MTIISKHSHDIHRFDKKVGDAVTADEVVMEIETDKTTVPVPSPAHGIIEEIYVADGDTVKSGQQLFKLKVTGEAPAKPAAAPQAEAPKPAAAAPPPPPPPKPAVKLKNISFSDSLRIRLFYFDVGTCSTTTSCFFKSSTTTSETISTSCNRTDCSYQTCTSDRCCHC